MTGLPIVFALSAPVETSAGAITAINVTRLPAVRDFLQCGLPVGPDAEYDMAAIARLLADCSDAPEFTFGKLGAADLFNLGLRFVAEIRDGTAPPLRAPTGADLIAAGSPVTARGDWNVRCLVRLGGVLSGLDAEAVQALPAGDFLALVNGIAGFLAPAPATP